MPVMTTAATAKISAAMLREGVGDAVITEEDGGKGVSSLLSEGVLFSSESSSAAAAAAATAGAASGDLPKVLLDAFRGLRKVKRDAVLLRLL